MELDREASTGLARIVEATGSDRFYPELCHLLSREISWEARMIMQYSKSAKPRYLWTENVPQNDMNLYLSRYYRLDPFFAYWREHDAPEVLRMSDTADQQNKATAYFRFFQPMIGSRDGMAVFLPIHGNSAIAVCFESAEVFAETDVASLRLLLPLLVALNTSHQQTLVRRLIDRTTETEPMHGAMAAYSADGVLLRVNRDWELSAVTYPMITQAAEQFKDDETLDQVILEIGVLKCNPLSDLIEFGPDGFLVTFEPGTADPPVDLNALSKEFLHDVLTPRERDIVMWIVRGASSQDIALELELSEGTIKNHRKRLYKKLGIFSERELLALYIRHISQHL